MTRTNVEVTSKTTMCPKGGVVGPAFTIVRGFDGSSLSARILPNQNMIRRA